MTLPKPGGPSHVQDLAQLWETVTLARSSFEDARSRYAGRHAAALGAQRDLLAALEDYVAALDGVGRPVPYRLRDELHLYRRLNLSG